MSFCYITVFQMKARISGSVPSAAVQSLTPSVSRVHFSLRGCPLTLIKSSITVLMWDVTSFLLFKDDVAYCTSG